MDITYIPMERGYVYLTVRLLSFHIGRTVHSAPHLSMSSTMSLPKSAGEPANTP
jgi:hypothetical protein